MVATAGIVLCLAYCAGLFWVSLWVRHLGLEPLPGMVIGGVSLLGLGGLAALQMPRWWRLGPQPQVWLIATLLALLGICNYGWQWPRAAPNDISQVLSWGDQAGTEQVLQGTVQNTPSQNRAGRGRFWLQVNQVRSLDQAGNPLGKPTAVQGRVYATADWERAEPLYPGQRVEVKGRLYAPSPAKNPNGFDFQGYLADNDSFAGFMAQRIQSQEKGPPPQWRLWQLRKRIAKAQAAGLGTPAGPLVSAMALGRQAVSLPYDIQDQFIQAGLAHTLAASGFHVSLLLGVLMALLKKQPALVKVGAGAFALLSFVGLAGAEPSVMRAVLMGAGALVGLALERKVKPLGCLLLAVTLLLVWQPLWIDSVGFRLSVMATFGLMVTASPLTQRLDWLPSNLASLVAVPIAAYIWTVPLQLYYFNTLPIYSILLNVVATPLVTVISLGGMGSAVVAALVPGIGEMLASLLYWPAHLLIALVSWVVSLPGNSVATGQISLVQMLGLYGLVFLAWLQPWCRRRQWILGLVAFVVAAGPLWYHASTSAQVTVLAAGDDPVLVAQDHRKTLLVNSGEPKTTFYTVLPFLRQAGVNRLDWAVALPGNLPEAWAMVVQKTPIGILLSAGGSRPCETGIQSFQPLEVGRSLTLGPGQIQSLGTENPILRLTLMENQGWLMLPKLSLEVQRHLAQAGSVLASEVLWWDGSPLAEELMAAVGPRVAIASASQLNAKTETQLQQHNIQVFVTERDGAVTWTPEAGFTGYLQSQHRRQVDLDGAG